MKELNNEVSDVQYYAINKNDTIEKIDRNLFLELSEKPDDRLKRLKVITHNDQKTLDHLRIFDTPGYGSIVAEHEEVLKEFLPNSDIIIYTVNYKIGIQDEDYAFLGFLRELIREDVKIFLLINRCPEGIDEKSPKIRSITKFVSDILTIDATVFTVPNIVDDDQNGHPLPHSTTLWASVGKALNSPERIKILGHAFDKYIEDLYHKCYKIIESKYLSAKISVDEFEEIKRLQEDSAHRIRHAIPTLVIPVFEKIEQKLPSKFDEVRFNVQKRLDNEIDISDRTGMEEMVSYTNSHLLPYTIKTETAEIQNYVDIELEDLNKKDDDYLQKEIVRFNNEITIQLQTNVGAATSSIMAGMLKEVGKNSLQGYFATFGGMGGANARVANAASHLFKKAGDLFGHTFSRATHNGVKHFLAKIGASILCSSDLQSSLFSSLLSGMPADKGAHTYIVRQKWGASTIQFSQETPVLPAGYYVLTPDIWYSGGTGSAVIFAQSGTDIKVSSTYTTSLSSWQKGSLPFQCNGLQKVTVGFASAKLTNGTESFCGFDNFRLTDVTAGKNGAEILSLISAMRSAVGQTSMITNYPNVKSAYEKAGLVNAASTWNDIYNAYVAFRDSIQNPKMPVSVKSVNALTNESVVRYDLNGRQIPNNSNLRGLYIEKSDKATKKVIIR